MVWPADIPCQTQRFQFAYEREDQIDFPPPVAMPGGARVCVMVVMPAFPHREDRDNPVHVIGRFGSRVVGRSNHPDNPLRLVGDTIIGVSGAFIRDWSIPLLDLDLGR